ncbi:MAG: cbb3-type cytochrome c oxidase subunit 3 [Alphaproteobacteria bacterium]|nr:cbb3-type cytochrome c oxidase subunit 3 [Alphaproteobacteria bacterium]
MDYETIRAITGTASLIFFVAFFAAVLAWTFWPGNRQKLEDAGRIPLSKD